MIFRLVLALFAFLLMAVAWLAWPRQADAPILRLGSTTSTRDSGLLDAILPLYEVETGVEVVVFAKGTGAAIRDGLAGRVDALLVHNREREEALVAEGYALERLPIMTNNFLFVGPRSLDTYRNHRNLLTDLARDGSVTFLSRDDDSGTHAVEMQLWERASLDPETFGDWYIRTGTGMGQTLITANAAGAVTLVDSATWARHGDRERLHVLVDSFGAFNVDLVNPYGYLTLNPDAIDGVNQALAADFGTWLAGPTGQAAIAAYTIDDEQAFFPHTNP